MPPPTRILLITERFPPDIGGAARSGARTAAALAALGVSIEVLSWTRRLPGGVLETTTYPPPSPSQPPAEASASVPVAPPSPRPPTFPVHQLGLYAGWDLSLQHTMNVLEWLHDAQPFDAVWGHYLYPAGFVAVWFGQWRGVPSTVSARGNDVDRLMFPPGDFARLTWTLDRADVVTAASHDLARKIDVLLGRPVNAHVLHNVIDPAVFSPGDPDPALRTRLGIHPDESVFGFSGELRHKKGADFLLAALHHVRQSRPACLLVIGQVRPEDAAKLAGFAAEHPDDATRVIVTGHLDDPAAVAAHLRLCDVFLHPALWEGLPNALLEAMACGRVVIASDAGGTPECVRHGEDGFLVPRAMLHRVGEAALEVLSMPPAERARVERAAVRRLRDEFSPAAEAAGLGIVLDRLR